MARRSIILPSTFITLLQAGPKSPHPHDPCPEPHSRLGGRGHVHTLTPRVRSSVRGIAAARREDGVAGVAGVRGFW